MSGAFPGFPAAAGHPCEADPPLAAAARRLLRNSIAPASWRAYASGEAHYRRFCARFGLPAVPAAADTLVYYLADLQRSGVAVGTARQRLAAVRHLHIRSGLDFGAGDDPMVRAAVRGFPARGGGSARPLRRGVTLHQLRALKTVLGDREWSYYAQRSIWAACCTAFYGGLRAGEYLKTGPGRGLRRADLAFSPAGDECVLELRIQKNRQFGPPVSVHLPATGTSTCPVRALRLYCDLRDGQAGSREALFLTEVKTPLTRRQLSLVLKDAFGEGYSTHSLRIGLATEAAAAGVPDATIQLMGRWRSAAYMGYVRGHRQLVSGALQAIARSRQGNGTGGPGIAARQGRHPTRWVIKAWCSVSPAGGEVSSRLYQYQQQ